MPLGPIMSEALAIKAAQFSLPADLLRAIVAEESQGNECATRFEPEYRWLWDNAEGVPCPVPPDVAARLFPPVGFSVPSRLACSRPTEWIGQKTSWGPMQVMGAVAREYGFKGLFPELCGVLGLYYGAMHLDKLRTRFFGRYGWAGVVAAYNAGSVRTGVAGVFVNQSYVDRVRKHLGRAYETL